MPLKERTLKTPIPKISFHSRKDEEEEEDPVIYLTILLSYWSLKDFAFRFPLRKAVKAPFDGFLLCLLLSSCYCHDGGSVALPAANYTQIVSLLNFIVCDRCDYFK
jgi:hypothetical protein